MGGDGRIHILWGLCDRGVCVCVCVRARSCVCVPHWFHCWAREVKRFVTARPLNAW